MKARIMFAGGILTALLFVFSASARAQSNASPQATEMKKLDFLLGTWQGNGTIDIGPGQRRTFHETEIVQSKLGGLLVLIQGTGKAGDKSKTVVHNALGLAYYDDHTHAFRWDAYQNARGSLQAINTTATVGNQTLVWGFEQPHFGQIRFTIRVNASNQWVEVGQTSQDGKTWQKFLAMTLKRVK